MTFNTFAEYLDYVAQFAGCGSPQFKAMSEEHKMLYERGSYLFEYKSDYEDYEDAYDDGNIVTGELDEYAIKFFCMCELYSCSEAEEWLIEMEYEEAKRDAVA